MVWRHIVRLNRHYRCVRFAHQTTDHLSQRLSSKGDGIDRQPAQIQAHSHSSDLLLVFAHVDLSHQNSAGFTENETQAAGKNLLSVDEAFLL